jgi:hypothetical protein
VLSADECDFELLMPESVVRVSLRKETPPSGCAARSLEQVEHLGGLGAVAGASAWLAVPGCFLGEVSPRPRIVVAGRNGGAMCGDTGLFLRFRALHRARGLNGSVFFRSRCGHFAFSLSGDNFAHDSHPSVRGETQASSARITRGDGMAVPTW